MNPCFVVASNNEDVLHSCLLASPDLQGMELSVQRGAASTGVAYNRGLDATRAEVVVFPHQDVYLPAGWLAQLNLAMEALDRVDPNWGVLGLFGVDRNGAGRGHVYSAGLKAVLGAARPVFAPVETLDEVLLVIRRSSGLRFDEDLPGFHLYGTDICLQAQARGLKAYAISAFCIHNSNGHKLLPRDFWNAYFFLRRKWSARLPITTPCTKITFGCWPVLRSNVEQRVRLSLGRIVPGHRVPDPERLYDDLVRAGKVTPTVCLI